MRAARVLLPMSLALTLAACGTTGSNPPPPSPPPSPPPPEEQPVSPTLPAALTQGLQLTGQSISGEIVYNNATDEDILVGAQVNPTQLTLTQPQGSTLVTATVDGESYVLATTPIITADGYVTVSTLSNVTEANPIPPAGNPLVVGMLMSGNHSVAALVNQFADINDQSLVISSMAYGGTETAIDAMPSQTASYEGVWQLNAADGRPPHSSGFPGLYAGAGAFQAISDFDANQISFLVFGDGDNEVGFGQGVIAGNTFESSFNVEFGPDASQNTVSGGFYGPAAQEIAGGITGTLANGGDPTNGALIGIAQ